MLQLVPSHESRLGPEAKEKERSPESGGDKGKLWVISQDKVQDPQEPGAKRICILSPQRSFSPLSSLGGSSWPFGSCSAGLKLQMTEGRGAVGPGKGIPPGCAEVQSPRIWTAASDKRFCGRRAEKKTVSLFLAPPLLSISLSQLPTSLPTDLLASLRACHLVTKTLVPAQRPGRFISDES